MDKLEFNQLELQDQVQYINDQLADTGLSVTKVCDAIGIDRSTVRKRFKKGGYVFNTDLNLYEGDILNGEGVKEIVPRPSKMPPKNKPNTGNTNTLEDRVKVLEGQIKALEQIIYNNQINAINTTNVINADNTSNTDINILEFDCNTVTRAYRMYEDVQKDFKIFCKKHSEYKVQDLISTALVEFMNKRK